MSELDSIKRILEREREARKQAERILEEKSLELYESNLRLKTLNASLESEVIKRTAELEAYAERLRILFDEHPFPMLVYAVNDLKILAVNQTAIDHYQFSKADFLQMSVTDLLPQHELDKFQKVRPRALEGETLVMEWQHMLKDGNIIDVEVSARTIQYNDQPARFVLMKDITEVKRVEQAIKKSEDRYRDLFENATDMIQSVDERGRFLYVNRAWKEKLGYCEEEIAELKFTDIVDVSEIAHCLEIFHEVSNCDRQFIIQTVFVAKDGTKIKVEGNVNCQIDSKDSAKHTRGIFRDVTGLREFEHILQENEKKYRELVESVSDIIYRCNYVGQFAYVNPTAEHVCGYTMEDLVGKMFTEIIREDYRVSVAEFYARQAAENVPTTYLEFPMITKSGSEIWIGQTVDIHFLTDEKNEYEFIALARNITDRILAQNALKQSEEKYRSIIENLELGLLEVDLQGIITNAYPKFCELSGYSKEQLIGQNSVKMLLPEKYWNIMLDQNQNRHKGKPGVYEVEIVRADGSALWVMISGAPYYNADGRVVGSVGIHLDISERKQMEAQLFIAKETAENSVRSKELFMANMSHEIRTPMNAIIGMGDLLKRSELNTRQTQYLDAIQTSARNLLVIINDILDFSKIESGKLDLEEIPVNLETVLKNAIDTVSLKAEQKGISLVLNASIGEGVYCFDPTRLSQVFINLLSNAVKFTSEGRVEFTASIARRGEIMDQIFFSVADTGIGIPPEKMERIFESFVQADESTARKYGGTGLGLPISKQLVELMGGELSIKSAVNRGSQFYFVLDLKKAVVLNQPEVLSESDESLLNGTRVLLVEDHEINRFMAITILEEWNCQVEVAVNGIEAIEKVTNAHFDVVLMDMRMPEMDGIKATTIIRQKLNSDVPIIALTANAIIGDSEKCLAAGMNDYISKPFTREELYYKMIKVIPARRMEPGIEKSNAGAPQEQNLVDMSRLVKSASGNQEFVQKLIKLFLNDTPEQIALMKANMDSGDFEGVCSIAHRIKPSIDHLASTILQQHVREIENGKMLDGVAFEKNVWAFCGQLEILLKQLQSELD